jgi:hypothetical protein
MAETAKSLATDFVKVPPILWARVHCLYGPNSLWINFDSTLPSPSISTGLVYIN